MTCFWDGIISSLTKDDYKFANITPGNHRVFISQLKNKKLTGKNITWMGKIIRKQEIIEHNKAINEYDISKIGLGHLTSVCDYFLLLICEIFQVNIDHKYLSTNISYKHKMARKTLRFKNNRGHFMRY
jgi:hypothetical protein